MAPLFFENPVDLLIAGLLILLLTARELIHVYGSPRLQRLLRYLNLCIVPIMALFVVNATAELINLLERGPL